MLKYLAGGLVLIGLTLIGSKAQQPISIGSGSAINSSSYPLLAPDGTTGAPSYSFATAATTGLFLSSGAIQFNVSGAAPAFVDGAGINTRNFRTFTNCSSSASPAACVSAAAGSVVVAAAATTVVVNTTIVTANSQIFLMYDSSLGTKLSVTCNTTEPALYGVTARTAGTSFTITSTASVTNPACFSYLIVN